VSRGFISAENNRRRPKDEAPTECKESGGASPVKSPTDPIYPIRRFAIPRVTIGAKPIRLFDNDCASLIILHP
jgi:hypothetical protein